jgi:hypothetical protein
MIHLVIGGTLSGKTTFVKNHFLSPMDNCQTVKTTTKIPLTYNNGTIAIGDYLKDIRTCGLDQMGRRYEDIADRLLAYIKSSYWQGCDLVMEGNALCNNRLLHGIALAGHPVKLWLITASAKQIEERYKAHKLKYGRAIVLLSYQRAFKTWSRWKGEFEHEMVV